jgi:aspartate/methionine/tyrosine aminotransferase
MIKKLIIEKSDKLQKLPPSPVLEAERIKHSLIRRGVEVIDLGEFNPDTALRDHFIPRLDPGAFFDYANSQMISGLKREIAKWLEQRYGIRVNVLKEILPYFGRKEIVYHLLLGLLNPGDKIALTDPCDPTYKIATTLVGAKYDTLPLLERNDYLIYGSYFPLARIRRILNPNSKSCTKPGRESNPLPYLPRYF